MLVEKAIVILLKFNNRVTIPNFGSIIKQADFSHAVFFNQFIRFDDGLLRTHLIKVKDCTDASAEQEIESFNSRVNDAIVANGSYKVDDLGYFTKQNGRIELVADQIKVQQEEDVQPEIVAAPLPLSIEEDPKPWAADDDSPPIDAVPEEDPYLFDELDEEETTRDHSPYAGMEQNQLKPRTTLGIGMIALIASLMLTAAYFLFFREEDRTTPATISTSENLSKKIEQASQIARANDPEPAGVAEPLSTSDRLPPSPSYHIIVGSFTVESNAEKFTSTLNQSGISALKLPRRGNYFMVSFRNHADLQTARKDCSELRQQYDGAWIIEIE